VGVLLVDQLQVQGGEQLGLKPLRGVGEDASQGGQGVEQAGVFEECGGFGEGG
jgi:hypothetical protein